MSTKTTELARETAENLSCISEGFDWTNRAEAFIQSALDQQAEKCAAIIRELVQSQLHFDYCRAMYQEGGDNETQLAQEVSEASCRRSDATDAAEEFLKELKP